MDARDSASITLESMARTNGARRVLDACCWLLVLACVYWIASDSFYQWDFEVYYSAAHALSAGKDPYALLSHANLRGAVVFQYPPLTLWLFHWTCWLTLLQAKAVWLACKLASLTFLACLWHRYFVRLDFRSSTLLFMAVAFNSTLLKDLTSGNIGVFEQLALWGGFTLLLMNRPYLAASCMACIAQFKLLPGCLLVTILFVRPRDGWKPFAFGSVLFLALLGLNEIVSPNLTREYIELFSATNVRMDDRNFNNPSSLAMFRDIVESTSMFPGFDYNRIGGNVAYCSFLLALVLLVGRRLWQQCDGLTRIDTRVLVYIAIAIYTITMPRMKDYSYGLMLIPALYAAKELGSRQFVPNFLVLSVALMLVAQPQQTNVPGMDVIVTLSQAYMPLLLTLAVLVCLLSVSADTPREERPLAG